MVCGLFSATRRRSSHRGSLQTFAASDVDLNHHNKVNMNQGGPAAADGGNSRRQEAIRRITPDQITSFLSGRSYHTQAEKGGRWGRRKGGGRGMSETWFRKPKSAIAESYCIGRMTLLNIGPAVHRQGSSHREPPSRRARA